MDVIMVSPTTYRIEDAVAVLLPGDFCPSFEPVAGFHADDEIVQYGWIRYDRPQMPIETTWHILGWRRLFAQTWLTSAVVRFRHGIVQTASGARYALHRPALVPDDLIPGSLDLLERALRTWPVAL